MKYDFSTEIDRTSSGSLKWDKYAGQDILPFWVADLDFVSAPEIRQALAARLEHGVFGYTVPSADTTRAVQDYLHRAHGWVIDPEWIVWMPGLVPALNVVCRAVGEPGDGVLTVTPIYPPFLTAPLNQQRTVQKAPLCLHNQRWEMDWYRLRQTIDERTRLFLFCNPHNPTGRVYSREELRQVADFCDEHNLILCSDEIHCDLVLDDCRHIPIATLDPFIAGRTITLFAPSKTYNLPGLCCAYAVIPDPGLRMKYKRAAQGFITEINCFGYAGCAAGYQHGEPWRQELLQHLRANRDRFYQALQPWHPKVKIWPMQATYLAWLDVSALGLSNPVAFFEEHGLGLSDGTFFGAPQCLRFNFGCTAALLEEGLRRLDQALGRLVGGG